MQEDNDPDGRSFFRPSLKTKLRYRADIYCEVRNLKDDHSKHTAKLFRDALAEIKSLEERIRQLEKEGTSGS